MRKVNVLQRFPQNNHRVKLRIGTNRFLSLAPMSTDFPSWILSSISELSVKDFQEWLHAVEKTEEFSVESSSNVELAQLTGAEIYQIKGGETNESK